MSHLRPVLFKWDAEAFAMLPSQKDALLARRQYANGHNYYLEPRDQVSHGARAAYFISLKEAYNNLPDDIRLEVGTIDKMRKKALCATGFRKDFDANFETAKDAHQACQNMVKMLAELGHDYVESAVVETCVRVSVPMSQNSENMDQHTFEQSSIAVLDYCAKLIGTTRGELRRNAGRSA